MATIKKLGELETCTPRAALRPVCHERADLDGPGLRDLAEIEQKVVLRLARGESAAEIADGLEITALAARVHIKGAYAALGARSKADLLARLGGYPVH